MVTPRKTYRYANLKRKTWLDVPQTAEYLNVSIDTVRRRANAGLIKRHGTGKGQMFRRDELDQYLHDHKPWLLPETHKLNL